MDAQVEESVVLAHLTVENGDQYSLTLSSDVFQKIQSDVQYREMFISLLIQIGVKPSKTAIPVLNSEDVLVCLKTENNSDEYHVILHNSALTKLQSDATYGVGLLSTLTKMGVRPTVKAVQAAQSDEALTSNPTAEVLSTPTKSPCKKKGCFISTPEAFKTSSEGTRKVMDSMRKLDVNDQSDDDLGVSPFNIQTEDTLKESESSIVLVSNLPPMWKKFHEKVLVASIMRGMDDALFCLEDDAIVLNCFDFSSEFRTVSVQFINNEYAKLCTFMQNVKCDGHTLSFSMNVNTIAPPEQITGNKKVACDVIGGEEPSIEDNDEDFSQDEEGEEFKLTDDEDDECSLTSPTGTTKFVRNLVRLRNAFSAHTHTAAYIRLQADLVNDEKLVADSCTVKKLKGKRRYLMTRYNTCVEAKKEDWIYFKPLAVYMGHAVVKTLLGTEFDPQSCPSTMHNNSPLFQMAKYTKGATWNEAAVAALVKAYLPYKVVFDTQPAKHSHLYNKIHLALKQQGFYFQPSQCEAHMNTLKKEFRDEASKIAATGEPGPSVIDEWPHYELMYPVMKDDVTVSPLFTVSAGMSRKTSIHQGDHASGSVLPLPRPSSSSPEGNVQGIKVNRDSTKRPSPSNLKERSIAALERFTQAVERKNQLAAELISKRRETP